MVGRVKRNRYDPHVRWLDYFDADVSKWNVSSITDMIRIFAWATAVDAGISKWDVSSVTDKTQTFAGATVFDAGISKRDVSSATVRLTRSLGRLRR